MLDSDFIAQIEPLAQKFSGVVGVYAERLDTGELLTYNADQVFPSASVVKLPVLFELFKQLKNKSASLDERIELRNADKVIGSGILKELRVGLALTLEDLALLMMTISDNTAANMVTDRVGIANVNRTMGELGLTATRVTGKILIDQTHNTDTPDGKGERAPATPAEMARLLIEIERREYLGAECSDKLLGILKRVQTDSTIARGLPYEQMHPADGGDPTIVLAHKTGSIRGVRNNVGLVYTPTFTYAIALMSKDCHDMRRTPDNEASVLLGELSRIVYCHFA
jgi:beta-lactamase class A